MLDRILKRIVSPPKEREAELELANQLVSEVRKHGRDAVLVGSIAKNTCLRGDKDIDIFILFPKNVSREQLEKEGLEIGRKVCKAFGVKPELKYAEHPYTRTKIKGYEVDIVPCYKIKPGEKIISAVDRSPLHTKYIKTRIGNKNNEVRLLKYFCKQIGVYGANIRVHGFSGYLCELLILHYGSFEKVLRAASKWHYGVNIDIEDHGKLKFDTPLVVIDPIDPRRNVAAALNEENFCWFIVAARYYLRYKKIPKRAKISKERGKLFVIEWKIKEDIEEIIWSQLESFTEYMVKHLKLNGFGVMDSMIWSDSKTKAQILLELEVWQLPAIEEHYGPPVYERERADSFIHKYKKVMVKGNKLMTEKKREFSDAKALLKTLLKKSPSHLGKNWKIKEGASAKRTEVFKNYEKKLWKVA